MTITKQLLELVVSNWFGDRPLFSSVIEHSWKKKDWKVKVKDI
jgi:hypothetical protein